MVVWWKWVVDHGLIVCLCRLFAAVIFWLCCQWCGLDSCCPGKEVDDIVKFLFWICSFKGYLFSLEVDGLNLSVHIGQSNSVIPTWISRNGNCPSCYVAMVKFVRWCWLLRWYMSTVELSVGWRVTDVSSTFTYQHIGCMGEVCSAMFSISVIYFGYALLLHWQSVCL